MNIGQKALDELTEAAALVLMEVYPSHAQDTLMYRQAWFDGFGAAAEQIVGMNRFQFGEVVMARLLVVYKEGARTYEFRKILRLQERTT